jgi:tRNA U34 2-thiouridine synthase MnmA/TrmU
MSIKALALLSGGLDSTLAVKVIMEQGIEVIALNFVTVFCRCTSQGKCKLEAVKVSENFGIKIKVLNCTERFVEIVKKPKFGYGSNMNPCIDCRINYLRTAGEYMKEIGASFIITGEVLGQRPMSQRRDAMKLIDKEAGLTGYVLRPLCAKHLEPTIPEIEGLVDREKLLGITGRSRKEQMQLADIFQIKDYPCSAGGCLLTDPEFGNRMKDEITHRDSSVNDIHLLRVGRHFRIDPKTKVIIGRKEEENDRMHKLSQDGDVLLRLVDIPGPLTLIRGDATEDNILLAARLTARCSKAQYLPTAKVAIINRETEETIRTLEVTPAETSLEQELLVRKATTKGLECTH